jgi:hypothetical protein
MIGKSGAAFFEKIMLKQRPKATTIQPNPIALYCAALPVAHRIMLSFFPTNGPPQQTVVT